MTKYQVKLGSFTFPTSPEKEIPIDDSQEIAKIDIPGARPRYQNMGPGEETITWNGRLLGTNAMKYKDQIKAIKDAGKAVTFSYGPMKETVIVRSFKPIIRRFDHILYSIELVVDTPPKSVSAASKKVTTKNTKKKDSRPASKYAGTSKYSGMTFTIKPGFYLWNIQQKVGIPWQELARYNKIKNERKIPNGTKILIP